MGTLTERKRKDGSTGYLAQIVVKRDGQIIRRENQTFDRRQAVVAQIPDAKGGNPTLISLRVLQAATDLVDTVLYRMADTGPSALGPG